MTPGAREKDDGTRSQDTIRVIMGGPSKAWTVGLTQGPF